MKSKVTIRGAQFRHMNLVGPKEGEPLARFHFRGDLSGPISELMGWEDIPTCIASSAKLPGEIAGTKLTIKPNDKSLAQYERCLTISNIEDFKVLPVKDEDGEIEGHDLEMSIKCTDRDSVHAMVELVFSIGRADCQLKVDYDTAEQMKLSAQADDEATGEDEEQPEPEAAGAIIDAEFPEVGEEPVEDAGPLPSAVTMAGSTEKLRKARRARTPRPTSDPGAVDWEKEQRLDPNVPHTSVEVM